MSRTNVTTIDSVQLSTSKEDAPNRYLNVSFYRGAVAHLTGLEADAIITKNRFHYAVVNKVGGDLVVAVADTEAAAVNKAAPYGVVVKRGECLSPCKTSGKRDGIGTKTKPTDRGWMAATAKLGVRLDSLPYIREDRVVGLPRELNGVPGIEYPEPGVVIIHAGAALGYGRRKAAKAQAPCDLPPADLLAPKPTPSTGIVIRTQKILECSCADQPDVVLVNGIEYRRAA